MSKNIFWRKYKELQCKDEKEQQKFSEGLAKSKVPITTFYKHLEREITTIKFKYILVYGKLFEMKIHEIAKEFGNEYSELFVNQ